MRCSFRYIFYIVVKQCRKNKARSVIAPGKGTNKGNATVIQLHGGIAMTDEYSASHYFKRLTVMEMTYGDTLHQLGEVSVRMQATAGVFA